MSGGTCTSDSDVRESTECSPFFLVAELNQSRAGQPESFSRRGNINEHGLVIIFLTVPPLESTAWYLVLIRNTKPPLTGLYELVAVCIDR